MPIYSKAGKDMVFDLINQANPRDVPFTAQNTVIEAITAQNNTVDGVTYNTKARVRGISGAGYTGVQTVYYNRLALNSLFSATTVRLDSYSAASVHEALPIINARYGLSLTTTDVVNNGLLNPGVTNYNSSVNLTGAAGSPLLTANSTTLYYYRGLPVLSAFILNKNVPAYTHPVSDPTVKSASMLTVGLDFTESKNLLLVDGTGMPNFAALSQVLTQTYGLPAWDAPLNSNYVVDVATSTVSAANQKFDRVVVQTGILNGQVAGAAYYHYMN